MFQCLGLGIYDIGGCGEDWWYLGCVVGMGLKWFEKMVKEKKLKIEQNKEDGISVLLLIILEDFEVFLIQNGVEEEEEEEDDFLFFFGFFEEDNFEVFLCYKCVGVYFWVK